MTPRAHTAIATYKAGKGCCLAVLSAFQDVYHIDEARLVAAAKERAGKAPEGRCGALHAALGLVDPALHDQLKNDFVAHTGAIDCKTIRSLKKVPCTECVITATTFIESRIGAGDATTPGGPTA